MRNDEFNNVKVTNTGHSFNREFGITPKTEFSSKDDTFFGHRDTTVNDNRASNDENVQQTRETTSQGSQSSSKNTISQEQITKATTTSTSATASASTAASAGAAASSVAAAASVIAVTAVSVAAGVTVMQNQNASCRLTDFAIYSNKIEYALVLENNEVDNFEITVESNNYINSKKIVTGENTGVFEELNSGETYSFYVKEEGFGGKVLLNQEFTTKSEEPEPEPYIPPEPESVSKFNDFVFDMTADFELGFFTVQMDFVDEKNIYSDFEVYLLDLTLQERINSYQGIPTSEGEYDVKPDRTYELEKTTETQKLLFNEDKSIPSDWKIDPAEDEFVLEFTYKDSGEKKTGKSQDNFTFQNIHQPMSEFFGYSLSPEADYESNIIFLTIDYIDDKGLFSDFDLYLIDETLKERAQYDSSIVYDAHVTLFPYPGDENWIYLDEVGDASSGSDWVMRAATDTFSYELTYKLDGVKYLAGSEENIRFSEKDTYMPHFYDLEFDHKINMDDNTFEVTMDYDDPREYFTDFTLYLVDESLKETLESDGGSVDESLYTFTYPLQSTTEVQTLQLTSDSPQFEINPIEDSFSYNLRCLEQGVLTNLDQSWENFTFYPSVSPTYGQSTFDHKINMKTYEFNITLDFNDPYGLMKDFTLLITDLDLLNAYNPADGDTVNYERVYSLEYSKEVQTLKLNDENTDPNSMFEPLEHQFEYTLSYTYLGEQYACESDGPFSFIDDTPIEPEFTAFNFPYTIDPDTYEFKVSMEYDDPNQDYSDFTLIIYDEDLRGQADIGSNYYQEFSLAATTDPQTLVLNNGVESQDYMFKPFSESFTYKLTCMYNGVTTTLAQSDSWFTWQEAGATTFLTLNCDYTCSNNYVAMVDLDYSDDLESMYDKFFIQIDVYGLTTTLEISLMDERQAICFGDIGDQSVLSAFYNGDPLDISVQGYLDSSQEFTELWKDEQVTFTRESKFEGISLSFIDNVIDENGGVEFALAYLDDDTQSSGLNLEIYDANDQLLYRYDGFALGTQNNYFSEANGTLNLRRATNMTTNMPSVEEIKANLANPVKIRLTSSYTAPDSGEALEKELLVLNGVTFS